MLKKLFITLLSSWVISPLGVMLAQANGLGSDESLKLFFLISGATVPFQLLLNECYAATGRKHLSDGKVLIFLFFVIAVQLGVAIYGVLGTDRSIFYLFYLGLASSLGLAASFFSTNEYYENLKAGAVRDIDSLMIGGAPGVASLLLYLFFVLIIDHHWLQYVVALLFVVPTSAQYLLVMRLGAPSVAKVNSDRSRNNGPNFINFPVILVVVLLLIASGAAAQEKLELVNFFPQHAVVFVYSTNLLITLANLFLKASRLSGKKKSSATEEWWLWLISSGVLMTLFVFPSGNQFSSVVKLFAAQILIVLLIEIGRAKMSPGGQG